MQSLKLGAAAIDLREPVVAGAYRTVAYTYTAGHPIDDSGCLKIVFRSVGDFGIPQFDKPAAPNYCRVSTSGDCRVQPRWDSKGHTRPWGRALYIKVLGGFLNTGEQITVIFGDPSEGSPGWQIQTFCEDTFEFKTLVDPIATYEFKELPTSPVLKIVAGQPVRAVCIAPSQVETNTPFSACLKLEDRWGNPTAQVHSITHPGFPEPGVRRIAAEDHTTDLTARSNPIQVVAGPQRVHPYWGDLHGQSEETIGSNSIDSYFAFARDTARLDMTAHQGNDFQVTDELWETINDTAERYYAPGSFVTFPGYEWSGNTPLGGDRNIYFTGKGGRIVHSCTDLLPDKQSGYEIAPTVEELFTTLGKQRQPQAFAFAHVGGRYADLSMHDENIELAVEVHSAWGTFEWLVDDALRRGYRIGICANSDGHKGRPGASYPGAKKFGSYGGLTCVLAQGLTREAIFEALQSRHFFATTGNRCLVDVSLLSETGIEAVMGDVVSDIEGLPMLRVSVIGTAAVESVEVRNGTESVATLRPYGQKDLTNRVKVVWRGAEVEGRERLSTWDGQLSVQGNTILNVEPINFWNASEQPRWLGGSTVVWHSITTGGLTGLVLTLEDPLSGTLKLETTQANADCPVADIQLAPQIWPCGGLGKQIEVYRLPREQHALEFTFAIALDNLHSGDNPMYVRVTQEDGHMAWTSPIYIQVPDTTV